VDASFMLLIFLVVVALVFDFLNGLHDAANSIATIVSTRVLPAKYAVIWAAFFNFIAFLFFGLHVATTMGKGILAPQIISDAVIFGALGGAITWNVVTWLGGIPSSSSHALIGGLLGAGIAKAGLNPVVWSGVAKTAAGIVLSPAMGFALALVLVLVVSWLFVRRRRPPPTAPSASCSSSRPRSIPWVTAAMTPRRPWASSRSFSIRAASSRASSTCRSGW
jgi:PiT family inorganic phosphate transporter